MFGALMRYNPRTCASAKYAYVGTELGLNGPKIGAEWRGKMTLWILLTCS